jgi:hypothetical protein
MNNCGCRRPRQEDCRERAPLGFVPAPRGVTLRCRIFERLVADDRLRGLIPQRLGPTLVNLLRGGEFE